MLGNPSVVSDAGPEENGDAGAPEGANTGFAEVVNEEGADGSVPEVCAKTVDLNVIVRRRSEISSLKLEANMG
ncbi:hypothetical protein [Spirosoma validum]|uniref:Uncharacterized protein n=1 Tax=Spirosoma validum TaxID=2771355 RepID=A0A927B3F6_9BACT|nr:hypothetical protein [Spirosoma validum]MBD2754664.1 hypothetical protein [Spirosoma validum]